MLAHGIRQALLAYVLLTIHAVLFVACTSALARAVGGRVPEARIGAGRVLRFKVAGIQVDVGVIPGLGSVTLLGRNPFDTYDGPGSWRRLGLGRRLLVILGPWLVILIIAVVCLSPARAFTSMARAVPQLLFQLDTRPLILGFLRVMANEPIYVVLGVLMAKITAFNLLPLPSIASGNALQEIVATLRGPTKKVENEDEEARPAVWPALVVALLSLYVVGRFVWGLIRVVL